MRKGKITPNGVVLEKHEMATVVFLTEQGYDIELVPRSNVRGEHTPDIKMSGLFWEMKAPRGEGKYLIQNTLHKAVRQSENIILDLGRMGMHPDRGLFEIKKNLGCQRELSD